MLRYATTLILGLGLMGVGIAYFLRGQTAIGIAFIAIAILRTSATLWSRKPAKPEPSVRLNLETPEEREESNQSSPKKP